MTRAHLELASEARWDPPGSQVGEAGLESGAGEGPGFSAHDRPMLFLECHPGRAVF